MTPTTNNVGPTTSATERLRALLDERGVEWTEPTDEYWELLGGIPTRNYVTIIGEKYVEEALDGTLAAYHLTPEQAVAATLGETPTPHVEDLGRLHDELRDAIVEILGNRCDWDQTGVRHAHEVLERAATLGPGTCHMEHLWSDDVDGVCWWCKACDKPAFTHGDFPPNYCPNCGRRCVG